MAPGPAASGGIVVSGPGREVTLTGTGLAALPSVQVTVPAGTAAGARDHTFEGPLLWTVLAQAGAVDPAKHQGDVRGTVMLTGRDGYTAVLALGELSPEFENKQVMLAMRADGQPLEPGHLRVVVPGDKRGGRGVHDLVRISVAAGPAPQHGAR
jgi:DMSO/TMAO reductase YedYZ molybdopterin-dependent catalytic subunit